MRMLVAVVALAAPCAWGVHGQAPERFELAEEHMGTTFRIVVYGHDEGAALAAADDAFLVIARLDSLLSDYRSDSEVTRLGREARSGHAVVVGEELWAVLQIGQRWSERTAGAFDVTIGPVSRLWRWSARRGELPGRGRLAVARAAVGWRHLNLDAEARSVTFGRPDMALDLGGVAKGYAADAALATLASHGVTSALVDAGGDLAVGAPPPGADGWRVGFDAGVVLLSDVGVATSGDAHRHVEIDGTRYAHLVDPRTGLGTSSARTVTVIAASAADADALASALGVMDPRAGRALVDSIRGVVAWVTGETGETSWRSIGFPPPVERFTQGVTR